MKYTCVWEHNGSDTLLYVVELPGAYARGASLAEALGKLEPEIRSYLRWAGMDVPEIIEIEVAEDVPSELRIADADSDVLPEAETLPLSEAEYLRLKALVLKSASDFLTLYEAVPQKQQSSAPVRRTFYGQVPRTATEMYEHTKSVNAYYFAEIDVDTDNAGTILECRQRGFEALEQQPNYLQNPVIEGSYGESWSLRKVLRRFLWHDRIHAKAMYRMAIREFGMDAVPNIYLFEV